MVATMGKRAVGAFGATVGVLIVCGLVLGFVQGWSTSYLTAVFGWGGIVATGLIGTPIHELGHFLMCKLFGIRVAEVALFRPVAGRSDGILGYVKYSFQEGSLWQRLGCFFVGIAPMVLGVVAILLILRFLTPEVFRSSQSALSKAIDRRAGPLGVIRAACAGFFGGLFQLRGVGIVRGLVCLYLLFSISTHMTLSTADLRGAAAGIFIILVLCVLFGVITTLLRIEVAPGLIKTAVTIGAFLSIGIVFAVLALGLFALIHLVVR